MTATLIDAMRAAGLAPAKAFEQGADGKLMRYRVEGDKAGSRNGWLVQYRHPVMAGSFGSWKTGDSHTWREQFTKPLTPAEKVEQNSHLKAMHQPNPLSSSP